MGCGNSKPSPVYADIQASARQATIDDAQAEQHDRVAGNGSAHPTLSITNESNPSDTDQDSSTQQAAAGAAAPLLRLLSAGRSGPATVFSSALSELAVQQNAANTKGGSELSVDLADSMPQSSLGDVDPAPNLSLVSPAGSANHRAIMGGNAVEPYGTAHEWKALYGQRVDTDLAHIQYGMLDISTAACAWPQHLPLSHILSFGTADCASAAVRLRAVARWVQGGHAPTSDPPVDRPWDLVMDLFVFMNVPPSSEVFQALLPFALRHMESSSGAGDFCRSVSARLQHATQYPTAFIGSSCNNSMVSPLGGLVDFFKCVLRSAAMAESRRSLPAAVFICLLQACGKHASAPKGHPLHAELEDDDEMGAWGVALRSAKWLQPPSTAASGDVVAGAGEVLLAGIQLAVASGNTHMLNELLSAAGVDVGGGEDALHDCPRDMLLLLHASSLADIAALHAQRHVLASLTNVHGALRLVPWQWGSRSVLCAAASGCASTLVDLLSWESEERLAVNARVPSQHSETASSGISSHMSALEQGMPSLSGPVVCRWGDVDVQAGGWAALPIAAALGHAAVVQQLLQFEGERSPSFWVAVHSAFLDACRWGRVAVLDTLLRTVPSHKQLSTAGRACFDEATGRPYFLDVRVANDAALFHAMCSGDSATVQRVLSAFHAVSSLPQISVSTIAGISAPLTSAHWPRARGHRYIEQVADVAHVQAMLGLLRSTLSSASRHSPGFALTFVLGIRALVAAASTMGNVPLVLELLQTQAGPLRFFTPSLSLGWDGALPDTGSPGGDQTPHFAATDSVLGAACGSGNTLLVQALLAIHSSEQPTPPGRTSWSHADLTQGSHQACQSGDLSTLQLVCRWGEAFQLRAVPDQQHLQSCFVTACAHGHLQAVQLLQAIGSQDSAMVDDATVHAADRMPRMPWLTPLDCACVSRGLLEASLWGHEHVVQWLLRHREALLEQGARTPQASNTGLTHASSSSSGLSNTGVFEALVVACTGGHTRVLQAFADMPSSSGIAPVDFAMNADTLFVSACQAGRTGVARLLTSLPVLCGTGVDLNSRDDKPFVEACSGGHLLLARWLLHQTGNQRVDPTVDDSAAFVGACRSGNLPLVVLLAGLRGRDEVDTATGRSFALVAAAEGNHAHVLCWLLAQRGAQALDVTENGFRAVAAATRVGAADALQVLLEQTEERTIPASVLNSIVLPCIGQEGHVDTLRLLLALPPGRGVDVHSEEDHLYKTAHANGCTDLLSALHTLLGHVWPSEAQLEAAVAGVTSDSEGGHPGGRMPRRQEEGSQSMQDSDSSVSPSDSG